MLPHCHGESLSDDTVDCTLHGSGVFAGTVAAIMQFRTADITITVNMPDRAALDAAVTARLHDRRGFALATLNLDHLVKLRADPAFRAAYAVHDLVTADGNPIVRLSRIARRPVALLPGADLVLPLARLAARQGRAVALVGSSRDSLDAAATALRAVIPDLNVPLRVAPPMGFDPTGAAADAILAEIAAHDIGLAFLALGAPKQEILAARGRLAAPATGFASIGAGLDFLSGHQRRAPSIMRRTRTEWLWRAASAPRRLGPRYLRCAAILPALTRDALRLRS